VLLAEAGGLLTDLCGLPLTYNKADVSLCTGLIASNGLAHEQIVETLLPLHHRGQG
jgi:3'(2'), 5'-bisphosphate nucleotidase